MAIYKVNGTNVDISDEDAQKLADAGENVWGFPEEGGTAKVPPNSPPVKPPQGRPVEPVSTDEIISGAPYEHRGARASLDVVTTGVADPNAIPDPSDSGPVEVSVKVRPKAKQNKDIEIEIDEDDAGSSIIRVVSKSASGASSHISSDSGTDSSGDGDDDGDSDAPTAAEMKNRRDVHIGRNINSEVNAGLG